MNCCSGLIVDHPGNRSIYATNDGFIQLMYNPKLWEYLCTKSNNLVSGEIYADLSLKIPSDWTKPSVYNCIRLGVAGEKDQPRLNNWYKAYEILMGFLKYKGD